MTEQQCLTRYRALGTVEELRALRGKEESQPYCKKNTEPEWKEHLMRRFTNMEK